MPVVRLGVAVAVLVGVLATAATAQAPVPTVAVTAGPGSISVTPDRAIAAGPTRFEFSRTGRGDIEAYLATLRAGVSVDELRRRSRRSSDAALGLVFLEAGAAPSALAHGRSQAEHHLRGHLDRGPALGRDVVHHRRPERSGRARAGCPGADVRLRIPRPKDVAAQRRHPRPEQGRRVPLRPRVPAAAGRQEQAGRVKPSVAAATGCSGGSWPARRSRSRA